jgi:cyclic beta-1,2-glucan synthetase
MDPATRTLYRSAVEELARGSQRTELDIAGAATLAASRERRADPTTEQERRGDPGYQLLGGGRRAFEAALSDRPPPRNWLARVNRSLGLGGYVTALGDGELPR